MVAAGVQFGSALQLSLLTTYVQTLGIKHAFSSFIWLCGPITGFVVQPCVGIWSDRCHSRYGRRRPFFLVGAIMIGVAVTVIGFSADIEYLFGDTKEHCRDFKGTRTGAAIVFVIGFWILDLANNTVQGPARALLADLSGPQQSNSANAIFCSWTAVGNILGFSAGSTGNWHRWFPFLTTKGCCEACGNLKGAFLVAVVFLLFCTFVTLNFAREVPLIAKPAPVSSDSAPLLNGAPHSHLDPSSTTFGYPTDRKPGVGTLVDWMGQEVYRGDPNGEALKVEAYHEGVREGAFGLLLNSITYSVPFSVTAELTADTGGGQGLAIGVLNLAIVVPQMIVSLGAGPWDTLFGEGNIPAFVLASISAFASGILAIKKLPHLSRN
ncbi:Sucrose transport protein SUC3 [Acorus gramineus]|uniref:Sucrose transport protein SUC3 n=1 Tax=Acorus gramineus TaxID=55184 RepID=A0AAV9AAH4_ACOGR|nr:Sucrose transport protein SUC3 [Acorus gramineus]